MRLATDRYVGRTPLYCHGLDHGDMGMMLVFNITGKEGTVPPQCVLPPMPPPPLPPMPSLPPPFGAAALGATALTAAIPAAIRADANATASLTAIFTLAFPWIAIQPHYQLPQSGRCGLGGKPTAVRRWLLRWHLHLPWCICIWPPPPPKTEPHPQRHRGHVRHGGHVLRCSDTSAARERNPLWPAGGRVLE